MTDTIYRKLWRSLDPATRERSAFAMMQLATIGLDGAPRVRTVVIRQASEAYSTLSFVTDVRSPKVAEIRRDPRVSLAGFNPVEGIQIRLEGQASVIDRATDKIPFWDMCRSHIRALFRAPYAPGADIASPHDPYGAMEHSDGDKHAFLNFCAVTVELSRLEWLDLSQERHQRCSFRRTGASWAGTWIAP